MEFSKKLDMNAVNNFISTIDRNASKKWHIVNAAHDANLYRWSDKTLGKIFDKLDKIYGDKIA